MTHTPSLIVGNWKMNGLNAEGKALSTAIASHAATPSTIVVLCPPFTALSTIKGFLDDSSINLGAQDCHQEESGAYTGNISATMLKDVGCSYVILGHSERRTLNQETNALIQQKASSAHQAGLITIICVGETEAERESGDAVKTITNQLQHSIPQTANSDNTFIAYEPIWAIGTGKTATISDISDMHNSISSFIAKSFPTFIKPVHALYGGSVKPDNAQEILDLDSVGGVLVGGASLDAKSFCTIIDAAPTN